MDPPTVPSSGMVTPKQAKKHASPSKRASAKKPLGNATNKRPQAVVEAAASAVVDLDSENNGLDEMRNTGEFIAADFQLTDQSGTDTDTETDTGTETETESHDGSETYLNTGEGVSTSSPTQRLGENISSMKDTFL